MVNERRDGGLLVPLGPELQACPRELLRQRRGHDGQPQYLVRWSLVRSEERVAGGGSSAGPDAGSVSLWMSAEEACASCPALLGKGKPAGPRAEEERAAGPFPAGGAAPDEASLREMEADVGSLVRRAGRQLGGTGAPEAASVLNTVHVLSAYAGIGSLAGAFRETGALDLLAKMLCHKEKQICRSAGEMLRVLASHDAGSRSYILLSLSQQDGAEQRMDFDSRYTLLELFAEMMSSEEHCMSFEGIHLPQIPGKQLFALVKRYLRVTSLLDELGSGEEQGGEQLESSRVKQEFEFSMAMAGLIVELLRAMGWEHSHEPEPPARQEAKPRTARSIFQPKTPACFAAPVPVLSPNHGAQKKQGGAFLTPSDFADRSSYVEYVQAQLVRGMRVRLLEDCGEVRAGEEGEFLHSTNRMHAAQVLWQSTGRTYWMHWHMLEIIGFGDQRDDPAGQEKEYNLIESFNLDKGEVLHPFFSRPLGGLCSLPYLGEQPSKAAETLSRAEWWELLFFVRQLEAQEQEEIAGLVQREQAEQVGAEGAREGSGAPCGSSAAGAPSPPARRRRSAGASRCCCAAWSCWGPRRPSACGSSGGAEGLRGGLGALQDAPLRARPRPGRGSRAAGLPLAGPSACRVLSGPCPPLRILNKFLDGYQEDALPWHECVEPCLSSLSTHGSDREVVQEVVGFLHRLAAASKDCAVAMCRAGAREALGKALEKHSLAVPMAPALLELLSDCEKFTGLHRTLTGSILAGCIQLALGQIEEHRRSQRPISIPFFDVFLRNLCRGSSVEVREDKCWEKVQVSSNPHRASKLTDRNPKTYWESNGSTGSHFITVHMHWASPRFEDSSYMPARVVVLGGDSPAAVGTVLNTVSVLPSASRVVLLRNMTRFWPVIQIRVKRCQQGGIDTRVRGIEVLGPKPTFWPVFREQLCRRTFLCCTARALAWCQEIRRDRGRLLQLFGKLNRALRHEQDFAERFLPDDEAARALGRACWEALVSPLVQSITSPDPSGVSPLAWLLSEYLGSGEPAQRPPARGAAFGSCVRLLTQLLVHVDPGGEAPPRVAAAQKPSAGRGCVCSPLRCRSPQVQRFLEAAGQAPDVAERYCGLYRRLRGATEELFGQRAAFVVALGQGFAGALLRLSFLAALHVSERFARYLDGKIQELHGAAGSTGLLQQVLEPFVVFSGLEFAHTFEHFYRLYLGERLLAQGPSWLEGAVLEQIGLCFPRRFPQEMLSDLAESEELRRQFRLFQLQERDKRLLGLGAGPESPEDEVSGAAGLGRGPPCSSWGPELPSRPRAQAPGEASAAEAPEVTVLALSPRCWPVSPLCHMDEPGRFFSAALSSPLGDFAAFCQSQRGWACARPRRLQWTWLGRAELRFGDCVLHVSTLQMYVLLRFNGTEEVAVESLLRATGLPAELLQQALAPLTEGEGVLVQSCALGGERGAGHPRVVLLPRQRYLRAERAESGALERKRNVLCCLITRVLKAEKQLHIDNLVFRVIDACQKGELGPGLQFLSFCCHSVDVLSCVLHLLNQGYLRRQEGRPHVLEYV
uniref:Cullin 9 n=1 Tax=Anser cygnoides TaxID=8845 RepID=A0A8B9ENK1_ANSCY